MNADVARDLMGMVSAADASPFAKTVLRAVVDASALGVDQGDIAEELVRMSAALCAGRVRGSTSRGDAVYEWIRLFSTRLLVLSEVTPGQMDEVLSQGS